MLLTDAHLLLNVLDGQCDMVDFTWGSIARSIGVNRYTCYRFINRMQYLHGVWKM